MIVEKNESKCHQYACNPQNPLLPAAVCFVVAVTAFSTFGALGFFNTQGTRQGFADLSANSTLHFFTASVTWDDTMEYSLILLFIVGNTILRSWGSEFAWSFITLYIKQGKVGRLDSACKVYSFLCMWYVYVALSGLLGLYVAMSRIDVWAAAETIDIAVSLWITYSVFLKGFDFQKATTQTKTTAHEKMKSIELAALEKREFELEDRVRILETQILELAKHSDIMDTKSNTKTGAIHQSMPTALWRRHKFNRSKLIY